MAASSKYTETLYAYLQWNAAHHSSRPALRIDGLEVTYEHLNRLVDEFAASLHGQEIACGDRIGIWLPNSLQWIVSFLACSAVGAIAVPINTRLTAVEMGKIAARAGAKAVIVADHYRGRDYFNEAQQALRNEPHNPLIVLVDGDPETTREWKFHGNAVATESTGNLPANLLAIKFTSGTTTGEPKGVMLTEQNFIRAARYASRCLLMSPQTQFISAAPFFHTSGSMHCITACLISGCTLHSMSSWDPERFVDLVEKYSCTVSHAPYFIDLMSMNAGHVRSRLRTLTRTTAAGLQPSVMRRVVEEFDIPGLATLYGMTETCGNFTMWFPDDPLEKRINACGRPAFGNLIRIAEVETNCALPAGEQGEIQMRGPGVTPGYYRNEELNREMFTDDGWFRSGDIGFLSAHGELSFVSRFKDIIRVGGENLTPHEVERVLLDTDEFESVCVFGVPDQRLTEVPVAVLIPKHQHFAKWDEVLSHARRHLADFKMPKRIYLAEELPYTDATRKVQRSIAGRWLEEGRFKQVV